jgi:lipid-binding SYLF domain-containing protein
MKHLLQDQFTVGGNASASVGPVGRTAEASTDAKLQAQILSWSRSKGLFAGASLEGAVIQPSEDANARLYGDTTEASDVLQGSASVEAPEAAAGFLDTARDLTKR